MKTFTDTQRVDHILALMDRGVASIPTFSRQISINDPHDRAMIDAAMRHEDSEKERIRTEKRHELLRQKEAIDRQLAALNSQP